MKGYRIKIDGKPLPDVLPKLYETMSVREIANMYHVSKTAVDSWAHKLKLRHNEETELRLGVYLGSDGKYHRGLYCSDEGRVIPLREIVIKYYPTMLAREIAEKFGVNVKSVSSVAYREGLKHTEDTIKRMYASFCSPRQKITDEYRKHQSDIHKKAYRREQWKAVNGMARNEKIRVNLLPKRIKVIKAQLCRLRNYFSDNASDSWALFYDEQTVRESPLYRCKEDYYTEKYHIKFLPADGFEEEESAEEVND